MTAHAAAGEVLRDPGFGLPDPPALGADGSELGSLSHSILRANPPDHQRMRLLISQVFTRRRVAALQPAIENAADGLLDRLADAGAAAGRPTSWASSPTSCRSPWSASCSASRKPARTGSGRWPPTCGAAGAAPARIRRAGAWSLPEVRWAALATVLFAVGQVLDGDLLIVIFATSGALEAVAAHRTAQALRGLLDLAPEQAVRISEDGVEEAVDAAGLRIGNVILNEPGELQRITAYLDRAVTFRQAHWQVRATLLTDNEMKPLLQVKA